MFHVGAGSWRRCLSAARGSYEAVRTMSVSKVPGGALPVWTMTVVLNPRSCVFPCSSLVKAVGFWFGFSHFCCAVVNSFLCKTCIFFSSVALFISAPGGFLRGYKYHGSHFRGAGYEQNHSEPPHVSLVQAELSPMCSEPKCRGLSAAHLVCYR